MDAGHASIRWFVGADVGFAIGPSHTDPRSGEILDADIGMSDVFARGSRRFLVEDVRGMQSSEDKLAQLSLSWKDGNRFAAYCNYGMAASAEMNFAMDVLEARGDLDPDSPEAEAFVQAVIKDVIMHEVGHTLGLKHNYKASTTVTAAQLRSKPWMDANGVISASVMDYNAYNIPPKGEAATNYNMSTLGPYDYWAIEYAYKPLSPGNEKAELEKIASRSTEPSLLYADDIDAGVGGPYDGMDPLANRFDLGDNPLANFQHRLKLAQELWARLGERGSKAGDDPIRARRVLASSFNQLNRGVEPVAKYVGGVHASRELPGSGKPAFTPVDPAQQRQALRLLATGLFSADSFKFNPALLANMQVDYNEWERGGLANVGTAVTRLQVATLDRLMGVPTASRLLELPGYLSEKDRKGAISLNEVYATLQGAVWSELKAGGEIDRQRRALQREHLKRVAALLTKPAPLPADALSLVRWHANQLAGDLRAAQARAGASVETRAHIAESLSLLGEALKATMSRT
jgi:Met-zincin